MIASLIFALALNCAPTTIINHTDTWNTYDQKVLDAAKTRCPELFKGKLPCVGRVEKMEPLVHRVYCGEEK